MLKSKVIRGAAHFAAPFEGFRRYPYRDSTGKWTYGFGATRDLQGNSVTGTTPPISYADAIRLLDKQMAEAFEIMQAAVTAPVNDNEGISLTDFVFNIGPGEEGVKSGFVVLKDGGPSTLLRLINENKFMEAADQFELWDHAGGVVLPGLRRRRLAEKTLFLDGYVPHPTDAQLN